MSFKLEHSNKNGTFKIKLYREVSSEEMAELCQLASNLVPYEEGFRSNLSPIGAPIYGPHLPADIDTPITTSYSQKNLGDQPVENISMGSYVEPENGFRIKMLYMIETGRVPAIRAFRDATGISIIGCKEIVYGNYPCPILTLETAQHILAEFRKLNVFAKIVSSEQADAA